MKDSDTPNRPHPSPAGDPMQDGASLFYAAETPARDDVRDLLPILTFLRQELGRSASMLRDMAGCLSEEVGSAAMTTDESSLQEALSSAVVVLQNEDRIQQRLGDSKAVLSLLEEMLSTGELAVGSDLDHAVINSLRLEETRVAFAAGKGLDEGCIALPEDIANPSVGDVDLF